MRLDEFGWGCGRGRGKEAEMRKIKKKGKESKLFAQRTTSHCSVQTKTTIHGRRDREGGLEKRGRGGEKREDADAISARFRRVRVRRVIEFDAEGLRESPFTVTVIIITTITAL
ncbi:hypothetical protein CAOG_009698 [Capsaspora owczarzaki ATCC 30864]|uniref:Uncharacterized protein n=1 Tax=Capsaspora owczarzaki (strain ATCC 30864) TaxID=595528 RepID=A0A0D2X2L5_CAPO3|nr:hypothetical protein CAOG_009698 [Capsaspora owczarzaki ATCC 30864]